MASLGNIDNDEDDDEEENETESVQQEEGESEEEEDEKNEAEIMGEFEDLEWVPAAVKDVAYYLRAHKFNDFDRRYYANETKAPKNLFKEFPDPPLRSLHWEVRKYCELGFVECLHYLLEKVQRAELRRDVDTVYVVQGNSSINIEDVDQKCQRFRRLDWIGAQPFLGPLERHQPVTTCAGFTMNEESKLSFIDENCDNFANCLDPEFQDSNGDPRASVDVPFQCAMYSFCPDSCCPRKHYYKMEECYDADSNPCYYESPSEQNNCGFNRSRNTDFVSIVLNRWNVSCTCKDTGYEWDSKFGMCVDIDECIRKLDVCDLESEACFNLPGSYTCGCQWGFLFDVSLQKCIRSNMFLGIQSEKEEKQILAIEKGQPWVVLANSSIDIVLHDSRVKEHLRNVKNGKVEKSAVAAAWSKKHLTE
ncbi:hypothetical protein L9F63_004777 [Diploptera punctata]|uniref:EGF-like calcium-binding domain-containing protein n=1 Tax=Diploptera punctata TaxID=6984 RepID=A0AAD7ZFX8_DIPPU|nr:hypothetical protein L9F63_004777 [Diploptera punctata]